MDRNSVIGLLLIGAILIGFTFLQAPSKDEYEKAKKEVEKKNAKKDSLKKEQEKDFYEAIVDSTWVEKKDSLGNTVVNEKGQIVYIDTVNGNDTTIQNIAKNVPETVDSKTPTKVEVSELGNIGERLVKNDTSRKEYFTLENDNLIVKLSNVGGRIVSVYLKQYETYENYTNEEGEEITPLQLFDEKGSMYGLTLPWNGKEINTSGFYFEMTESTDEKIVFRLPFNTGQYIEYSYTLNEHHYDLQYDINFQGLGKDVKGEDVILASQMQMLKTEKLLSEQRRYAGIFYKYKDDGYNYMWENSDDKLQAEESLDWVAFKQSYFSTIFMSKEGFGTGTFLQSEKNEDEESNYLMNYIAEFDLEITNTDNATESIQWYFGPNDYQILASYDNDAEDIINYGWGIFRWVNIYMIQPIFNLLTGWGLGIGLAIFILTLFVKLLLSPITFKMYTSSAKMKVLKPEIQELNEKYPDKADAMKKQQETMKLYSSTGVNPLAGCIPMLIQMPILFAVFRFFPSSIDLRQENFLWAEDLSAYDSILDLGFNIPLYGDHVSLFTLLMAGSTLIYTVYNSSNMTQPSQPGMPNMKVIMYIFPFMMIFFFNNFAAGLSYYYLISNLLSIGIMFSIKKYFVDEAKIRSKIDQKKNDPDRKNKKSKFQERLEMAQKMQQEKKKRK